MASLEFNVNRWLKVALGLLVGIPLVAYAIGMLLPRDHVARMAIDLASPPDRVWALVSNFEDSARWRSDISGVQMRSAGPPILVDGAPAVTPIPIRFVETSPQGEIEFVVVSQDVPRRQVVRIVDDEQPFGGTWTWEIEPAGAGSRLTITENGFVKSPIFRVVAAVFFSPTATMEAYLRALAKELGEPAEPYLR